MKKIILNNLKRECLLVELPAEVDNFEYVSDYDGIYLQWHDGQIDEFEGCVGEHGQIKLSDNPRDWFKRLGHFPSLTEQDFYDLVDSVEQHGAFPYEDIYFLNYKDSSYSCAEPKQSFLSAVEAEGWLLENPYGVYQAKDTSPTELQEEAMSYALWKQAQEKVIDLNNCYLFVKWAYRV